MEIRDVTSRIARELYKLNCRQCIFHTDDQNWIDAERIVHNILNGEEPLCKYEWMLDKEHYDWLEKEVKEKHGVLFHHLHETLHVLTKIDEELNDGNVRKAQEIIENYSEKARVGMLSEAGYG